MVKGPIKSMKKGTKKLHQLKRNFRKQMKMVMYGGQDSLKTTRKLRARILIKELRLEF
jgi:hypothetical protein